MKQALHQQGRATAWLVAGAIFLVAFGACGPAPQQEQAEIEYVTPTPRPMFVFGAGGDSSPPDVVAAYGIPTPSPTPTPTPTPEPPPPTPEPAPRIQAAPSTPPTSPPAYAQSSGSTIGCPEIIASSLGRAGCMISYCESTWNPNATGSQGERGYFQIHPRWHPDATYDPAGNVAAASRISRGGTDWSQWTTASVLSTGRCPDGRVYPG